MFNVIDNYLTKLVTILQGGQKTSMFARKKAERNNVLIGMHSYGSCFDKSFNLGGKVQIGRYCSFGPSVRYFGGNHPIKNASMSPYFYKKEWGYDVIDIPRMALEVGNDVWVGFGSIITSSCRSIGNGAVIGAGAVVTKNVPPYAVVVGVPAKIIGYRFSEDIQNKLERSRWWEREPCELMEFYNLIDKPDIWADEIIRKYGD